MAFYLRKQRNEDVVGSYRRYQAYLREHEIKFPPGAFALASEEWYQNPNEHRCPHDGWLERITIAEPSSGERHEKRTTTIHIRLLGAYHDGFIEFHYPQVFSYSLTQGDSSHGHRDWLYDEFRLSDAGHMLHEIEWSDGGTWLIEASDVQFLWLPHKNA